MKEYIRKYHYLYRIDNLINGKFYIGIHSTNKLEDGYFGSGVLIKKAIKKYGVQNFKKTILSFCSSREEVLNLEKIYVNKELCLDENCYNLRLGGDGGIPNFAMTENFRKGLEICHKKRKESGIYLKWSIEWKGYNNPEFLALCKNKYEKNLDEKLFFIQKTNLPDREIEKMYNVNCHNGRCIKYLIDTFLKDKKIEKKYVKTTFIEPSNSLKTFIKDEKIIPIIFFRKKEDIEKLNEEILNLKGFISDMSCTDSMIHNYSKYKKYHITKITSMLLEYEILNVVGKKTDVNVKNGKFFQKGKKTLYEFDFSKKIIMIDKEKNLYGFDDNGAIIQKGKFRLQDFEN